MDGRAVPQGDPDPALVKATEYLRYLPPIGFIPLGTATSVGFDYLRFFADVTYREPVFIEGSRVEPLIRKGISYAPVDLSSGEMVWLYYVRENMESIDRSTTSTPEPYMIFATGHIPWQGDALYDLERWDYSNYD